MTGFAVPTGVHLLFINEQHEVLLMLRQNTGFFDDLYSLPGGHLEAGESIFQTACREAAEELDLTLALDELETIGVIHRWSDSNRIDFFVRARHWRTPPKINEPDKCTVLKWCPLTALPDNTVPYIRYILQQNLNGFEVLEFGF